MKKTFFLLLALVMTARATVAALATPFYLEAAGVTVDVPVGMAGQDVSGGAMYCLAISGSDHPAVTYACSLRYMVEFAGCWLEDLSDEEADALLAGVSQSMADSSFDIAEINGYKALLATDEDTGARARYISLFNGWLCDIAAANENGEPLTGDQIALAAQILVSIQFDEDGEGVGAEAGGLYLEDEDME